VYVGSTEEEIFVIIEGETISWMEEEDVGFMMMGFCIDVIVRGVEVRKSFCCIMLVPLLLGFGRKKDGAVVVVVVDDGNDIRFQVPTRDGGTEIGFPNISGGRGGRTDGGGCSGGSPWCVHASTRATFGSCTVPPRSSVLLLGSVVDSDDMMLSVDLFFLFSLRKVVTSEVVVCVVVVVLDDDDDDDDDGS